MMWEETALGQTINRMAEELAARGNVTEPKTQDIEAAIIARLEPRWRAGRGTEPYYTVLEMRDLSEGAEDRYITAARLEKIAHSRLTGQNFHVTFTAKERREGLAGTLAEIRDAMVDTVGYESAERRQLQGFIHAGTAPDAMRQTLNRIISSVSIIEKRIRLTRETDAVRAERTARTAEAEHERNRAKSREDAETVNARIRERAGPAD